MRYPEQKTKLSQIDILDMKHERINVIGFNPALKVDEFTDISIRCESVTTNNASLSGNIRLLLVKNA